MRPEQFIEGARSALPVCLGVVPVGVSFGLLAVRAGLTGLEAVAMSALVMAGSSQLMVVGMVGAATIPAMVAATFFMNLRHLVMSGAAMRLMGPAPLGARLLGSFALCDESFALFSLSEDRSAGFLLGANTALYATWVLASALGVAAGGCLPEVAVKALGVAFYASFLALLVPNMRRSAGIALLAVLAALINTVLRLFVPGGWAQVLSMVVAAAAGTRFVKEADDERA